MGDYPPNVLIPANKKTKSIFSRSPGGFTFPLMILAFLFSIYLGFKDNFGNPFYLVLAILLILIYIRKNRLKGIYWISEDGLVVPYTWLTTKKLKSTQIINISPEKLTDKDTGVEYDGLRITIDNSGLKFNFTGIQDPSIVLSTINYEKKDLDLFSKELEKLKRNSSGSPNTLPQRLTDQVNNSWFGRWKLVVFNTIDSSTEFAYYLLLFYVILSEFTGNSLTFFLFTLWIFYFVFVFIYNISDIPSSIIGIRPHELGALIYNEADLLTTVRFILMSQPETVILLNCELLFEGQPISQIHELKELHPTKNEPGMLTYCVAQFLGNHTKSIGANIKFKYSGEDETEFELSVYWA